MMLLHLLKQTCCQRFEWEKKKLILTFQKALFLVG